MGFRLNTTYLYLPLEKAKSEIIIKYNKTVVNGLHKRKILFPNWKTKKKSAFTNKKEISFGRSLKIKHQIRNKLIG